MSGWTDDELSRIGRATELRLASRRPDGSLSRYAAIWAVVAADAVYVLGVLAGLVLPRAAVLTFIGLDVYFIGPQRRTPSSASDAFPRVGPAGHS